MRILIDIDHAANVHYFRNFIKIMEEKGHSFVIMNRDDKMIIYLLEYYNIIHYTRNKRPKKQTKFKAVFTLLKTFLFCLKLSIKEQPDFYMGFASSSCAIVSFIFRKPCVLLDDTEHNHLNRSLYKLFYPNVLTPYYFNLNMGKLQTFFHAYMEQLYLHSSTFTNDESIYDDLHIKKGTPYVLFRYIAYDAVHLMKVKPIDWSYKRRWVEELSKIVPVFVSLEQTICDNIVDKYLIKIAPEKIHSVIKNAAFIISEGATMASEAGVLGTPYIYINPLQDVGNIQEQVKKYPDYAFSTIIPDKVDDIITNLTSNMQSLKDNNVRVKIEEENINPTRFLVWFIENYPQSIKTMQENTAYQYWFK